MAVERFISGIKEKIFYQWPKSVGTIRVAELVSDRENKGFQMAILDFEAPWAEDKSAFIKRIPEGFVGKDQIVEVWVRRSKMKADSEVLVAIRPFNKGTYGKYFVEDERILPEIFSHNVKNRINSPRFFKKFLTRRE